MSASELLSNISTRDQLALAFGKLGFKIGAEIGVRKGHFSIKLLEAMGDGKLILVDPWVAYDKNSNERVESFYRKTLKRLSNYSDNIIIKRMMSDKAADEVEDGSLDFVYIDAAHDFNNVMMDILKWAPKVKSGGVVSGHDYWPQPGFGVIAAIKTYSICNKIKYSVIAETTSSWFFINP